MCVEIACDDELRRGWDRIKEIIPNEKVSVLDVCR